MLHSKRILAVVLAALMALTLASTAAAASISVKVDGTAVKTDVSPVIVGNSVLVSTKTIADGLGATATYSASKKEATLKFALYTFVFTMDSANYTLNGAAKTADTAAKVISGKPMVSLKAVAEGIGGAYAVSGNVAKVSYFSKIQGSIKITGSTTVQPISQKAADQLNTINKGLLISVAGGGSGTGIKDTIAGTNNLGASSRELTPDETYKGATPVAIAADGVAVIVNPKNPVANLTKDQVAKIFLGTITNWKDVGGNDAPILVMTRETGSGTRATLEELLLGNKSVVKTATPYASSALILQAVAKDQNAIGFDSLGYVNKTVKVLSLNNILPTTATIKNATYPISRKLFLLYKGTPTAQAALFIDFCKTRWAQDNIITANNYVAIK